MSANKIPVGILGATGVVGQRFIQLLESHPWFEIAWLAASERSAGLPYRAAARWRLKTPIPRTVESMPVTAAMSGKAPKVIFSALDAGIAAELEPQFAALGHAVISNASAFRMQKDVPLLVPEVNAAHVALLDSQSWRRASGGFIVTNPNCSATGLVLALAPLHERFGVEKVFVVTMQAISGAGYPGVASLDILGNVIPFVPREEEKIESESCKILGRLNGESIQVADCKISAQCNRVPVEDGHMESVSIKLKQSARKEDLIEALQTFRGVPQDLHLPSAPEAPVQVLEAPDRPQPGLDVNSGGGMTASIGGLRPCHVLEWKFTVLSHNTIRGAAGGALLNAELLKARGYIA
jgi:aspartate-semialdehyde dehydrogenase